MTLTEADRTAIEETLREGFSRTMLEANLRLTPKQRWRQHDEAMAVVDAYEEKRGKRFSEWAIIQMVRTRGSPLLMASDGGETLVFGSDGALPVKNYPLQEK
jgi:hypothetical protein